MKQHDMTKTIFSFFGPPGSGKGTLAQKLVQRLNFQVLSTGNLCREHVSNGTEFGKMLDQYLKNGQLIPDALITDMVIDWLVLHEKRIDPVILDGFPRTQGQAKQFFDFLKKTPEAYHFRVVFIEIPDDEIVKRLSSRFVCSNKNCQTSFSESDNLTYCKLCNSSLVRRDDDKEDVVRERLKQYPAYRNALLDFYKSQEQLIEELDIKGLTPDQVYDHFIAILNI